jgi:hypothetical protein
LYPTEFNRTEPEVESQGDWPQPKLRRLIIAIHVHMRWLIRFMTVKIHAIRTRPQDRRHGPSIPLGRTIGALNTFAQNLELVKIRADGGGHSAPETVLRSIYDSSLRNLARAILEMDAIAVYDNGEPDTVPRVLLQAEGGNVVYVAEHCPEWLERALVEL